MHPASESGCHVCCKESIRGIWLPTGTGGKGGEESGVGGGEESGRGGGEESGEGEEKRVGEGEEKRMGEREENRADAGIVCDGEVSGPCCLFLLL